MVVNTTDPLATYKKALQQKKAKAEGLAAHMAASEKKVAARESRLKQAEEEKNKLKGLLVAAEEKEVVAALEASFSERENKLKEEAARSMKVAKKQAMTNFLKSSEFETHCANELLSYYYQGKHHVLRMAAADGIALDQLLSWTLASHYCAHAHGQHGVVPFSEDKLLTAKEEDAEGGQEVWAPPPVRPINLEKLVALIEAGGGAKCDHGQWTLSDPPAKDANTDAAGPSK